MSDLRSHFVHELQDLWSANDQMKAMVADLANATNDSKLADKPERSADGIQKHTDLIRELIGEAGGDVNKEKCKGMDGLATEARKHAIEADMGSAVRDVAIISQYQRMRHYGIAGFGAVKAYAEALGHDHAASRLDHALDDIYEADEYMSDLAERSNLAAAA